jgi:hypothetical protein
MLVLQRIYRHFPILCRSIIYIKTLKTVIEYTETLTRLTLLIVELIGLCQIQNCTLRSEHSS